MTNGVEEIQRRGWLWAAVPEDIITSEKLEPWDKIIYAFLLMRSGKKGNTWYGLPTICEELKISDSTVRRAIKRLIEENWIRRSRRIGSSSITYVFERQEDCLLFDKENQDSSPVNAYNSSSMNDQTSSPMNDINRESNKQRKLNTLNNINEQMQESSRTYPLPIDESLEEILGKEETEAFHRQLEQDKPPDTTPDAIKAIQEVAQKYPNRIVGERLPAGQIISNGAKLDYDLKEEYEKAFTVNPTWDRKANKDFLAWLKERPSEQTIAMFAHWWRTNWRGKKGDSPSVNQVMELWPQAFLSNGANKQSRAAETF